MRSEADDTALTAIQKEYEKELTLPLQKPERIFIVCPVGLIGAGKTTALKLLAKKLPILRISSDEIRKLLSKHSYGWNQASEVTLRIAEKYVRQGYAVAVDADCVNKKERMETMAEKTHSELIWMHINTPESFILAALTKRPPSEIFKNSKNALRAYWKRKSSHKGTDLPFSFTLNPSQKDFHERIEKIAAGIQQKFF